MKITLILLSIFLIAQIVGLYTVNRYIKIDEIQGEINITYPDTILGEAPNLGEQEKNYSFLTIIIGIIIVTLLLLLLIKWRLGKFWRYGFFIAVLAALSVAFGVYINNYIAIALALLLAYFKVFKSSYLIHNFTEIFLYAGIAIMVLPLINLVSAFGLMIVISFYDMYAVWKSKHMITLAKFQTESKAFAGLSIPYQIPKKPEKIDKKSKSELSNFLWIKKL